MTERWFRDRGGKVYIRIIHSISDVSEVWQELLNRQVTHVVRALPEVGGFFQDLVKPLKANFPGRKEPADIVVQAGLLDLNDPPLYSQLRFVQKIAVHESYGFLVNNIALLKLVDPFDFAKSQGHIGAVCLPAKDQPLEGNVVVTGWGAISDGGPSSSHLLAVSVPVLPSAVCTQEILASYDSKIMFCTSNLGRDSCQGDLGGPAVQKESGSSILVGVVSSTPCGLAPVIYTRVSAYTAWIYKNIAKLQS